MDYNLGIFIQKKIIYWVIFDRRRSEFVDYGYEKIKENYKKPSKVKASHIIKSKIDECFKEHFNLTKEELDNIYHDRSNLDLWTLRREGLERKLTQDEYVQVLHHIFTHRGIEKKCDEEITTEDEYISEYICKNDLNKNHKKIFRQDVIKELKEIIKIQRDNGWGNIDASVEKKLIKIINTKLTNKAGNLSDVEEFISEVLNTVSRIFCNIYNYKYDFNINVIIDSYGPGSTEDVKISTDLDGEIKEIKGSKISNLDRLKYSLYKEQNGICLYSGDLLDLKQLFADYYAEIDHIIPKAMCSDNSYNNKCLVKWEENRDKSDRTPYEYLLETKRDWNLFIERINSLDLAEKKKMNLLNMKGVVNVSELCISDHLGRILKNHLKSLFTAYKNQIKEKISSFQISNDSNLLNLLSNAYYNEEISKSSGMLNTCYAGLLTKAIIETYYKVGEKAASNYIEIRLNCAMKERMRFNIEAVISQLCIESDLEKIINYSKNGELKNILYAYGEII